MPIKIVNSRKQNTQNHDSVHTSASGGRRSKPTHTPRPLKPDIPIKVNGPQGMHKEGIPREPDYDPTEDRVLFEEQQTSRCEHFMLRGYRDRIKIAALMKITPAKADDHIRRVFARWEIEGGQKHFTTYRGEMVLKLRLIETNMWEAIDHELAKTDKDGKLIPVSMERQLSAYSQLLSVTRQRAEMLGLTKEMIERMMETESKENLDFKRSNETFEIMRRSAARFAEIVDEEMNRERGRSPRGHLIEGSVNAD
jgi:hypothetical protein